MANLYLLDCDNCEDETYIYAPSGKPPVGCPMCGHRFTNLDAGCVYLVPTTATLGDGLCVGAALAEIAHGCTLANPAPTGVHGGVH
jgi:ribosomal protein S27E